MNTREVADKIYDDLRQKIFEWKEENAIARFGSTPDDYRNHSLGATEYSYKLLRELTSELISRFADDGELNETWYKEVAE